MKPRIFLNNGIWCVEWHLPISYASFMSDAGLWMLYSDAVEFVANLNFRQHRSVFVAAKGLL